MQNDPRRDDGQQPKGDGGQQPKGGGGNAPRSRGSRKGLLDLTNVLGAILWLFSALLTAIFVMLVFIKLPSDCLGDRGQLAGRCIVPVITATNGLWVILGAVLVQFIISAMIWRLRNPSITRIGNLLEWVINFVGFFWLICIQVNVESASGVYAQVTTFIKNFTVPTIGWWLVLITLSVGLDILTHNLFSAPPTGVPPSGVQRR